MWVVWVAEGHKGGLVLKRCIAGFGVLGGAAAQVTRGHGGLSANEPHEARCFGAIEEHRGLRFGANEICAELHLHFI